MFKPALGLGLVAVGIIALVYMTEPSATDTPAPAAPVQQTKPATAAPKPAGTASGSVTAYPSMTKEGVYLVYYTSGGFTPRNLEIAAGKSVRFVNQSGKAMQIGSTGPVTNPAFATFNQPKTVGQGGTYEYTFNDRAVFTYANRSYTPDQGTITVR